MKIYIAGPMRGKPDDNFPAFHAAAGRLRSEGYEIVNPAENFSGRRDLAIEVYLRRDAADVLTCDAVALLAGWLNSQGCLFEIVVAMHCGVLVLDAVRLMPIPWLTVEWAVARLLALRCGSRAPEVLAAGMFLGKRRAG